jgi:hypothetical protein
MATATGLLIERELTPAVDTAIYAVDDVLFVPTEITNVFRMADELRKNGSCVILNSVIMLDVDDETAFSVDLLFFRSNVTLGTINEAVTISDADADELIGVMNIAASDVVDLVNSKAYFKNGLGIPMQGSADSTSLYVGAVLRSGTPTFTAATDLKLKLNLTQD